MLALRHRHPEPLSLVSACAHVRLVCDELEHVDAPPVANDHRYTARRVTIDPAPASTLYEEFHPFGTTSYAANDSGIEVSAKRYRYIGKERDEETGLYHLGARYYASWLGRWTAADPIGLGDGVNRYTYARGNPIRLSDAAGMAAGEPFQAGETLTRKQFDQVAEGEASLAPDTIAQKLPGEGGEYFVVPKRAVNYDRSLGVDDAHHIGTQWRASTSGRHWETQYVLAATRIAQNRQTELAAGQIVASKKMIAAAAVIGVGAAVGFSVGGYALAALEAKGFGAVAASSIASGLGGAAEGTIQAGGLSLIEGKSVREAAVDAAVGGGFGLAVGGAFGAAAGWLTRGASTVARAADGGGKPPNLFDVLGKERGTLTKQVLKGREPLGSLTEAERQAAAEWYRGVAERTVGKNAEPAKLYNIARAEYLEGTRPSIEATIVEFMKNNGL